MGTDSCVGNAIPVGADGQKVLASALGVFV